MNHSLATNLTFRNLDFAVGTSNTQGQNALGYSILNVSCISDTVGILEVQYGSTSNGTFTTFYKFNLSVDTEQYNACSVRGRYCRLKFTNNTASVGKITCDCILTTDSGGSNVHNTNVVSQDFNSMLVRQHSDLLADMINAEYEGYIVQDITGIAEGITNTNKRNFWNLDSNVDPVLTANVPLFVISDNAGDKPGSTGIHSFSFTYIYLDSSGDYARGIASGICNGTVRQTLSTSGIAITEVHTLSAGSNKANLGNLTFQGEIGPLSYQDINYMPAGYNKSKLFLGVPIKDENLIVKELQYGGSSQFIAKIRLSRVNKTTGIRIVEHEEIADGNNHYSKLDCALQIKGNIEYLVGEVVATATPPASSHCNLHLSARGIFKTNDVLV